MGSDLAEHVPARQRDAAGMAHRAAVGPGPAGQHNPNVRYLHDGRARSIEEAILWHGGQAASARDRFKALSADDRQKVIDMVNSR